MKNVQKIKYLLSKFVDFGFIVILSLVIIGSFLISKALLYPDKNTGGEIRIRTELMPAEYSSELCVGDAVFDTLTKRRIGEITELEIIERENKIYFFLTLDADFIPRSKALRTPRLWFYFAREDL